MVACDGCVWRRMKSVARPCLSCAISLGRVIPSTIQASSIGRANTHTHTHRQRKGNQSVVYIVHKTGGRRNTQPGKGGAQPHPLPRETRRVEGKKREALNHPSIRPFVDRRLGCLPARMCGRTCAWGGWGAGGVRHRPAFTLPLAPSLHNQHAEATPPPGRHPSIHPPIKPSATAMQSRKRRAASISLGRKDRHTSNASSQSVSQSPFG